MTIKCPRCHFDNPDDTSFCGKCATPLPAAPGRIPIVTETFQSPVQELVTGATIAGRYQVIEELGHGGMGRVYKVFDTDIKEKIALKLLRPEISLDKEAFERFSNELKLARKVRHKNVCGMFDLGRAEGMSFITMEFVPGEDLKKLIRKMGQISPGRAVSIAEQVCDGLAEVHRLGIVHRDLKPQNIMVDEDANVRVMDFGIARMARGKGITGAGTMIGTPEYMSPEQVEGKDIDRRSDIYSLGVILYEMLTGRVPFEGDTPITIGVKHRTEVPPSPRKVNAQIPPDLDGLVLRCLEKDKAKRFQSAGELRADLERIEQGLPTTERVTVRRKPLTSKQITVSFPLKKVLIPAAALVALAVMGIALMKVLPRKAAPAAPSVRSIAVLPFKNISATAEDEAFSNGITEDITTQLSKIGELDVRSPTSAMRYKASPLGTREIGRELNAAYLLTGSVRRAEDKVHITAQLIAADADKNVWADTYDRDLKEIFAIQSEIAREIAAALKATLSPDEKVRVGKEPTRNIQAYEYYIRGREYYGRYRKQDVEQAIVLFKKAIELDPDYALAHAGLADAYAQGMGRFGFPAREWFDPAIAEAEKAIALDPNLPEGYKALGTIYRTKGWTTKALEAFRKAVEANPNNAVACLVMGEVYVAMGELDKAFPFAKKGVALSPAMAFAYQDLGEIYLGLDDRERAEPLLKKALELQPDLDVTHSALIGLYLAYGENGKAIAQGRLYLSESPDSPSALEQAGRAELYSGHFEKALGYLQRSGGRAIELAYIYWKEGKRGEARKILQEKMDLWRERIEQGHERDFVRIYLAEIFAIQGNKEEALGWMRRAVDAGWYDYGLALKNPLFENIRDDERFQRIIAATKAKVAAMRQRVARMEKEDAK